MSKKFEDFVSSMKVAKLKDELKKRGLPLYGNKAVLQQRLFEALQSDGGDDGNYLMIYVIFINNSVLRRSLFADCD